MLKVLDLFSGIGGFSLGLEQTGHFKTVAFCEIDKYCRQILEKHWKKVKIYNDVKEITKERLQADGIDPPAVITGGFPCQPFSVAGNQKGTSDDRHLWPEMFRIIQEFTPRWVVGENVKGITNIQDGMVFETVCTDLEGAGYEVRTFNIPACSVGAPHRRERMWIVAHSKRFNEIEPIRGSNETQREIQEEYRTEHSTSRQSSRTSSVRQSNDGHETTKSDVADSESLRFRGRSSQECGIKKNEFLSSEQERSSFRSEAEGRSSQSREDVANTESISSDGRGREQHQEERSGQSEIGGASSNMADTNQQNVQTTTTSRNNGKNEKKSFNKHDRGRSSASRGKVMEGNWLVEPDVGRVAHGISGRVHRLKALGNSIVPQIAEEIGKAIYKATIDGK